jgi:hypothetical protein
MKKSNTIKRTLVQTKKGVKAYYFKNGKRIKDASGRLKWVKQNYEVVDRPYAKTPVNLTAEEIKTYNRKKSQAELYRYKGKPVDKLKAEFLKSMNLIRKDDKERDILKLTDQKGNRLFDSYGKFENVFEQIKADKFTTSFESLMGAEGWRGRTSMQSAISVVEGLNIIGYGGWKLEVTLPTGQIIRGKEKGFEAMRNFEEEITAMLISQNENVAAVSFTYSFDWDFVNKIISINLWDSSLTDMEGNEFPKGGMVKADIRQSDPIKRTR